MKNVMTKRKFLFISKNFYLKYYLYSPKYSNKKKSILWIFFCEFYIKWRGSVKHIKENYRIYRVVPAYMHCIEALLIALSVVFALPSLWQILNFDILENKNHNKKSINFYDINFRHIMVIQWTFLSHMRDHFYSGL